MIPASSTTTALWEQVWVASLSINSRQSIAVCNIAFVYSGIFYKPFYIYHHCKYDQLCIPALFFAPAKLGKGAVLFASFKVGIGKVVQNNFIVELKKVIGSLR